MTPTKEIDLPELLDDYDWQCVFGEGQSTSSCSKATEPLPPEAHIDTSGCDLVEVQEVIAAANGENRDEPTAEWVGLFRMAGGRFLVASGWCDYTGWG